MMIRRVASMVLVASIGAVGTAPSLAAQSGQHFSVQGSLLLASQKIGAKAVNGVGFEGMARFTPNAFSIGLGFQYSTHKSGDDDISISGIFLEPRYAIDIRNDRIAPYVAARLAFLHESLNLALFPDSDFGSNGSAFGAGAGFLISVTRTINIDIGAAFVRQSFGDANADSHNVSFPAFTGYVAKAGLSFGIGS